MPHGSMSRRQAPVWRGSRIAGLSSCAHVAAWTTPPASPRAPLPCPPCRELKLQSSAGLLHDEPTGRTFNVLVWLPEEIQVGARDHRLPPLSESPPSVHHLPSQDPLPPSLLSAPQNHPPKPTDDNLSFFDEPRTETYVRAFGGFSPPRVRLFVSAGWLAPPPPPAGAAAAAAAAAARLAPATACTSPCALSSPCTRPARLPTLRCRSLGTEAGQHIDECFGSGGTPGLRGGHVLGGGEGGEVEEGWEACSAAEAQPTGHGSAHVAAGTCGLAVSIYIYVILQ